MNKKTVSIILATYQGEKHLSEQLDSLINQSYPYLRIHAFDDASSDQTVNILQAYQKKHSQITIHTNSVNRGFVKNFLQAIEQVESDYIALCDQDDIWHENKISICMQEMKALEKKHSNSPILIHSDLEMISENGAPLYSSFFEFRGISEINKGMNLSRVLGHNGVMGNSILMNKALATLLNPYPEILKDHDYWIALVNEVSGIRKTLNKPLVQYRIHENNTSNSMRSIKGKSELVAFFQEFLSGNAPLPFMENNRLEVLSFLKKNHAIRKEDIEVINLFMSYLRHKDTKFNLAKKLFSFQFLKPSILYRIHFVLNLLTTDRYLK